MRISRTDPRMLRPHTKYSRAPQTGSWPAVAKVTSGQGRQEKNHSVEHEGAGLSPGQAACIKSCVERSNSRRWLGVIGKPPRWITD